ncbi:MAG TPA: hypothetical protein VGM14_22380, partial [Streptosporangiaceae bacterium]
AYAQPDTHRQPNPESYQQPSAVWQPERARRPVADRITWSYWSAIGTPRAAPSGAALGFTALWISAAA